MRTTTKFVYPALAALALACFALSPTARAQLPSPTPDGGYPGENTAEGDDALFSLTTGTDNTAMGFRALYSNTTAGRNTANGANALYSNTSGDRNTATGSGALYSNTTGIRNTANGVNALVSNTTGNSNTAYGISTLASNTIGNINTATGAQSLASNISGNGNTANGVSALLANTTGDHNTASGGLALTSNTTGVENTAGGFFALLSNTTGSSNTASGTFVLQDNTTGGGNTAFGFAALQSSTTGSNNIALGSGAGSNLTTSDNNIDIGNLGVAGESNTIRIGTSGTQTRTFIAGINGAAVMGGAVKVNAAGQLGTAPSSQRFKEKIQPMDKASEAILALKPVAFRYKKGVDPDRTLQFGLVAEDVEKVNRDLVFRDAEGKVYSVRYEAVNAMLLNEFLKEYRTVQQQQKEIDALRAELKEQRAFIQKVNDKVELSTSAPQTVANNQ